MSRRIVNYAIRAVILENFEDGTREQQEAHESLTASQKLGLALDGFDIHDQCAILYPNALKAYAGKAQVIYSNPIVNK